MNMAPQIAAASLSAKYIYLLRSLLAVLLILSGSQTSLAEDDALAKDGDWLHAVRPGDTYASICAEYTERVHYCTVNLPAYNYALPEEMTGLPQGSQVKIPVEWLVAPPVSADVEMVRGDAFVERRTYRGNNEVNLEEDGTWLRDGDFAVTRQPLKAGSQLKMRDRIITKRGNVLLRFADQSSFLMKSNSELVLERLTAHGATGMVDTHMRLKSGSGHARVNSRGGKTRYRISTPAAIAAARGTDFSISAEPADGGHGVVMRSEVLEGMVTVSSTSTNGPLLAPGFGAVAAPGAPISDPIELLPASKLKLPEETSLPFTLKWREVADAEAYSVEVFEGLDRSGGLVDTRRVEQAALDLKDLDSGEYSFVVRAVDQHGLRGWEASADTTSDIELPVPSWQHSKVKVDGNSIQIAWSEIQYADAYQLQVSEQPDFGSVIHEASTKEPSLSLDLPQGPEYYARVRAEYSHYGASEFSESKPLAEKPRSWWIIMLQGLGILAAAT